MKRLYSLIRTITRLSMNLIHTGSNLVFVFTKITKQRNLRWVNVQSRKIFVKTCQHYFFRVVSFCHLFHILNKYSTLILRCNCCWRSSLAKDSSMLPLQTLIHTTTTTSLLCGMLSDFTFIFSVEIIAEEKVLFWRTLDKKNKCKHNIFIQNYICIIHIY